MREIDFHGRLGKRYYWPDRELPPLEPCINVFSPVPVSNLLEESPAPWMRVVTVEYRLAHFVDPYGGHFWQYVRADQDEAAL